MYPITKVHDALAAKHSAQTGFAAEMQEARDKLVKLQRRDDELVAECLDLIAEIMTPVTITLPASPTADKVIEQIYTEAVGKHHAQRISIAAKAMNATAKSKAELATVAHRWGEEHGIDDFVDSVFDAIDMEKP